MQELGLPSIEPTAILLTACGELETAGLKELIERSGAQVVASPAGVARIRQMCPPETVVLSADELPEKGWFPVTPIPLGGRGEAPVAYQVTWAGKTVLFAGAVPSAIDANPLNELLADLAKSRQQALAYNAAMQRLAKLQPDRWLPTVPYHGRNANLYGREWSEIVEKNQRAAEFVLQKVTGRE